MDNNIASTSTTTGSLQVGGGCGIIGNIHCGGNINCNGKLILLEANGDQIQITSNNNNWLFNSYSNSVYSSSNCLSLRGWSNNAWTNTLFEFCQNGALIIKTATNSTPTTTGSLQLWGGCGIQQNLYVGGSIYIGELGSNTDPLYISRINSSLNITEMAVYIGDDGVLSSSLSTFPPTTEAFSTDYFTIRSSNVTNPFHAFSSTGNYYCAKNIYCGGIIYLGVDQTSNTDPMYITRSNVGSNITEIAVYIGDDGINSMSYPSGTEKVLALFE